MTTLNEAKVAINDRMIAEWAGTTPIIFDNEILEEDINESFVRLYVRNLFGGQETLGRKGNRKYERNGVILIQVLVKVNIGTVEADALAYQAQQVFEGESFNGVTVNDSVIREIGNDEDNARYQINVEAAFNYFEIK